MEPCGGRSGEGLLCHCPEGGRETWAGGRGALPALCPLTCGVWFTLRAAPGGDQRCCSGHGHGHGSESASSLWVLEERLSVMSSLY